MNGELQRELRRPRGYVHGVCPSCAAGDHDEHDAGQSCPAAGCCCDDTEGAEH